MDFVSLISNLIIQVCKTNKVALVDIYSDSMGKALDLLRGIGLPFKLNSAESKSFETIDLLLSYKYFIGTNSKISIWVIIFRICNDRSSINFYPKEIAEQLRINVPTFYQAENLGIYQ